ncbi:hypothetical protein QFC24_003738 [Naganishia onofrii]|uniref:Uncharacterized protein n=1 Tax=Naganishia onofrii TaxID=1851511 RepID=A0ACC2XI60_9TREE|nr:hypothetical protein QFC24_003738 [Naganishia onofrii]
MATSLDPDSDPDSPVTSATFYLPVRALSALRPFPFSLECDDTVETRRTRPKNPPAKKKTTEGPQDAQLAQDLADLKDYTKSKFDEIQESVDQATVMARTSVEEREADLRDHTTNVVRELLTDPAILAGMKRALLTDQAASGSEGSTSKKGRRAGPRAANPEQQMRKSRLEPHHWEELPQISNDKGTVRHWPRPALVASTTQPFELPVEDIVREGNIVADALVKGVDVIWPVLALPPNAAVSAAANDGQGQSSNHGSAPASHTNAPSATNTPPAASVSIAIPAALTADDSASIQPVQANKTVSVWRPHFSQTNATTSTDFREEVKLRCSKLLESPAYKDSRQYTDTEIDQNIWTYWENCRKMYKIQLSATKIGGQQATQRRDRRKLRSDRASQARFDLFDKSPLAGTVNAVRLKKGLAAWPWSIMPEYLSDDEEERFVKRADLDEREMYYRAANKDKERYNKQDMWESREPFFFTYECREASFLLDNFVNITRGGLTPIFRVPVDLLQKDWDDVTWPPIRSRDSNGEPDDDADGYVIYDFMVDHAAIADNPGYAECKAKLYPDPVDSRPTSVVDPVTGISSALPTVEQRCSEPAFSALGLWSTMCQQFAQTEERQEEATLVEKYSQLQKSQAPTTRIRAREQPLRLRR